MILGRGMIPGLGRSALLTSTAELQRRLSAIRKVVLMLHRSPSSAPPGVRRHGPLLQLSVWPAAVALARPLGAAVPCHGRGVVLMGCGVLVQSPFLREYVLLPPNSIAFQVVPKS